MADYLDGQGKSALRAETLGRFSADPIFRAIKDREDTQKCLKEACAWWDMHYNCCAILSSAILLEVLAKREKAQSKTYEEKS